MSRVTVVGTTSWGTTLAIILARRKHEVALWARTGEEADQLNHARENSRLLPGIPLPPGLTATEDLTRAFASSSMIVIAVPSKAFRTNLRQIKSAIPHSTTIISTTKGLELETAKRMSQIMLEELPRSLHEWLCVLSGPNLSREIAQGQPSTTVIASSQEEVAKFAQEVFMSSVFRVYTNSDVVGVELGGALKNIIALGAGMSDGLGFGNNVKAAFMTRGLAEIARLGVAAGANPLTFAGLAGLGDLIATCASPLSRNRYVGEELAKGRTLNEVLGSMKNVAEGVDTTVAARKLAQQLGVEMPITELTYRVLYEGFPPSQAWMELMGRAPRAE